MKLLIAGSRELRPSAADLFTWIQAAGWWRPAEIISGGARGVDASAVQFAQTRQLPLRVFEADWVRHGRAAGPRRNEQMSEYADALLAVWDLQSRGTAHMIQLMLDAGKPIYRVAVTATHLGPVELIDDTNQPVETGV